nr:MFS transporter [Epidermidibacterium keratini]
MLAPKKPGSLSKRQRWSALTMLSVGLMIVVMDMTILIMALPNLVAELSSTATEQLWIVDVYSLVLAGLLIPMSAVADRWGRKKILLTGFAIFGIVSALVLIATTSGQVIALRAALGVGGAMIMPTTLSMIRTIFTDPAERARALAVWSVTAGLGAVVGPLVGGALLEFFSWHSAFLINVPIVILAITAGIILLPEARDPNPPRWDMLASLLAIAGMVGTVWGIKNLAKNGLDDFGSWAMLAGGLAILALFVLRCLHSNDPMLDLRLFKSKPFSAGVIAALVASLAMAGVLLLVAQWLQTVGEFTPILAGVALLPMALGGMLSAPFAPALAQRTTPRAVITGGLVIAGVGILSIAFMGDLISYWQFVVPLLMVGAGTGSLAIASAIIMGSTPTEKAGNAAAIEESMYDVGNVLGIAVIGSAASAIYRSNLGISDFVAQGLDPALAHAAEDSIVGAMSVSNELDIPALATAATDAFNDGLGFASIIGGVILLLASITVFRLVPKKFSITGEH